MAVDFTDSEIIRLEPGRKVDASTVELYNNLKISKKGGET